MLGRKPLACFCLVALAACGPENGLESASPAALWEGDNLLVLDADLDPDRANLQIAVADAWVGVTSITHFGVVNAGRIALRIEQVEVPPEVVVAIPPGVQPAARAEVAVHRVAAEDGAFRSLVDLATNDPKYPLLRIRLVGRALSVDDPNTEEPEDPGTEEPEDPGTEEPEDPGTEEPEDPGTEEPEDPGTEEPGDPPAACWDRTDALRSERKIDVLWVLDNSDVSEIFRLPDLFRPFLSSASQLDYQIGITTNGITPAGGCPGGANGGENGRLFPVDGSTPRIITSAMPVAVQEGAWRVNTLVGNCHFDEQLFEGARRALSPPLIDHADDPRTPMPDDGNLGFLRPDADLAIVFMTDEPDQSTSHGLTPAGYAAFFQSLKPGAPHRVKLHGIVGPRHGSPRVCGAGDGDRIIDGIEATGGFWMSICEFTRPDLATRFEDVSRGVFSHVGRSFHLSGLPVDRNGNGRLDDGDFEVRVDGVVVAGQPPGRARIWRHDPATNEIRFEPLYRPALGAEVRIRYRVECEETGG